MCTPIAYFFPPVSGICPELNLTHSSESAFTCGSFPQPTSFHCAGFAFPFSPSTETIPTFPSYNSEYPMDGFPAIFKNRPCPVTVPPCAAAVTSNKHPTSQPRIVPLQSNETLKCGRIIREKYPRSSEILLCCRVRSAHHAHRTALRAPRSAHRLPIQPLPCHRHRILH